MNFRAQGSKGSSMRACLVRVRVGSGEPENQLSAGIGAVGGRFCSFLALEAHLSKKTL